MKHTFETKVYYADTDSYGVVWHGAYLRWMEKGRVDFCGQLGLDLVQLKNLDVLLPVTTMTVKYKSSAKLNDNLIVETWFDKMTSLSVTFKQVIKSKETGKIFIEADFDVVAVNSEGKLYRRIPEDIAKTLERGLEKCPAHV